MLEGMNYLHAKFQINIFGNKKVIKLLELWTLWRKKKRKKKKEKNSEYNRVVITTLKIIINYQGLDENSTSYYPLSFCTL